LATDPVPPSPPSWAWTRACRVQLQRYVCQKRNGTPPLVVTVLLDVNIAGNGHGTVLYIIWLGDLGVVFTNGVPPVSTVRATPVD